jgi:hypothetical protein
LLDYWMAGDTSGSTRAANGMTQLEDELTRHLERANELGRQAKLANDAVEEELRLTRLLAEALRGAANDR